MNAYREVLWAYGHTDVGFQPGSFTEALINALMRADQLNFRKLESVYPEYAEAVNIAKNSENAREDLLAGSKV